MQYSFNDVEGNYPQTTQIISFISFFFFFRNIHRREEMMKFLHKGTSARPYNFFFFQKQAKEANTKKKKKAKEATLFNS